MVKGTAAVRCKDGLHLRPAQKLCYKAMEFEDTKIMIHFRNKEFNAKSVLGVLSACVQQNDVIELECIGPREQEALDSLTKFLESELV